MKTKIFALAVVGIVALTAIKEDAAEAVFTGIKCYLIVEGVYMYNKIRQHIRLTKLRRLREDNIIRRGKMRNRNVYSEVWVEEAAN